MPLPVEAPFVCAVVTPDVKTLCVDGRDLPVTVDVPKTRWGDLLGSVDDPDTDTGGPLALMNTNDVRAAIAADTRQPSQSADFRGVGPTSAASDRPELRLAPDNGKAP